MGGRLMSFRKGLMENGRLRTNKRITGAADFFERLAWSRTPAHPRISDINDGLTHDLKYSFRAPAGERHGLECRE